MLGEVNYFRLSASCPLYYVFSVLWHATSCREVTIGQGLQITASPHVHRPSCCMASWWWDEVRCMQIEKTVW